MGGPKTFARRRLETRCRLPFDDMGRSASYPNRAMILLVRSLAVAVRLGASLCSTDATDRRQKLRRPSVAPAARSSLVRSFAYPVGDSAIAHRRSQIWMRGERDVASAGEYRIHNSRRFDGSRSSLVSEG